MAAKTEIVYWAENEAEAVVIIAELEQNGIHAYKFQESYGSRNALSFGIFGQIAIAVDANRKNEAEALILSMEDYPLEDDNEIDPTPEDEPDSKE